ncbi:sugar ABC transporter ATP-binding protein [Metarhizobium album]|uniref:Sugar ABC transporter ATP-binding protein n=1 Tax=Metarhizobium album TaxID=2182425 RepID=A0A2U2DRB4_9HYPH|nr:sugar ABC transporter ATP-binding protein [Rhizobium album]PWE55856.1 sugar ABC transporter ATP-binding protein [Rhizobium album]
MLVMTDIVKRYGPTLVLDGVGLAVKAGEVMALMGENGAGKSTLVKILAGIEPSDQGRIEIDGKPVAIRSPGQARAAGVGYVAQELSIIDSLSVAENVFLGDSSIGIMRSAAKLAEMARPYLDRVGLDYVDPLALAENYSVAERQLIEIARLLSRKARIAILDEPTAALSESEIIRVKAAVRAIAADGCAVIYVTHRMPEVFELTNRVTVLRNGKSFAPMETATLSIDTLIEAMLGRQLGKMFPPRAARLGAEAVRLESCMTPGLKAPVSLSVRSGEILALAGQVGSGASTILRLLAGVTPLGSGAIFLEGNAYAPKSVADGIASKVVYCSDDRKRDGIFAVRSVPENLSAPALSAISRFQLLSGSLEKGHIRSIAAKFGLDERYFSRLAGNLSGGNQQKVALGKWIGLNPKLLLVEEPTRGVDVGARAEIYKHLRELADGGLSIIFASSDTQEVLGLADRIATFFHGQLVQVVAADTATAESLTRDVTRAEQAA